MTVAHRQKRMCKLDMISIALNKPWLGAVNRGQITAPLVIIGRFG